MKEAIVSQKDKTRKLYFTGIFNSVENFGRYKNHVSEITLTDRNKKKHLQDYLEEKPSTVFIKSDYTNFLEIVYRIKSDVIYY